MLNNDYARRNTFSMLQIKFPKYLSTEIDLEKDGTVRFLSDYYCGNVYPPKLKKIVTLPSSDRDRLPKLFFCVTKGNKLGEITLTYGRNFFNFHPTKFDVVDIAVLDSNDAVHLLVLESEKDVHALDIYVSSLCYSFFWKKYIIEKGIVSLHQVSLVSNTWNRSKTSIVMGKTCNNTLTMIYCSNDYLIQCGDNPLVAITEEVKIIGINTIVTANNTNYVISKLDMGIIMPLQSPTIPNISIVLILLSMTKSPMLLWMLIWQSMKLESYIKCLFEKCAKGENVRSSFVKRWIVEKVISKDCPNSKFTEFVHCDKLSETGCATLLDDKKSLFRYNLSTDQVTDLNVKVY